MKSLEKECVSDILGLSSATTTQARTRDRSRPRAWTGKKDLISKRTEGLLYLFGVFNYESVVFYIYTHIQYIYSVGQLELEIIVIDIYISLFVVAHYTLHYFYLI